MSLKKHISILLSAAALVGCLTACGQTAEVRPAVKYDAAITVWYTDDGTPMWQNLAALSKTYNSGDGAASGVTVTLKSFDSDSELMDAITSGGKPSLVVCSSDAALALAKTDGVAVSTSKYVASGTLNGLVSSYIEAGKLDGTLVGVPLAASMGLIMVNSALTSKLSGYSASAMSTPEGVCQAANSYVKAAGSAFFTSDSFSLLFRTGLAQYGDEFRAQKESDIKSEHYVYLYNLLANTAYNGGVEITDDDPAGLVAEGKLPCAVVTSADAAKYAGASQNVAYLPYPVVKGGKALYPVYICDMVITATAENECQASAAFIQWLLANSSGLTSGSGYYSAAALPGSGADSASTAKLDAAVSSQSGSLYIPSPNAEYFADSTDFESSFREILTGLS